MKSKIFKQSLLTMVILLTMSSVNLAQEVPVAPPAPPEPPELAPLPEMPPLDSTHFTLNLSNVHVNLNNLHVKLNRIKMQKFNQQMKLNMKNFDKQAKQLSKNMVYKLDSLKSLTYNFDTNIAPQVAFGFKDFDQNFTYNTTVTSSSQSDDAVEKVKNYSKSYTVDGNDVITIDNRFGKITVNTWAKNEVKVDVQIKVAASDDNKAQKLLDNVTIRDSKDGSGVSFKTDINSSSDNNSTWGSLFGGNHSSVRKIEVNYTVYMPIKNPLTVSNKYGSTNLPDLDGKLTVNNSYGSLVAKSLSNTGNQISVKYGSATIGALNGSDLDVAYGSLNLGECNRLNADISYGSAKIGRITTSGNINVKFSGALNIGEIDKNVKNLAVNASYSSVKLGISNDQNADFDVTVHYGNFNYGSHDINITSKSPADGERGFNPTKNYKGHLGKGSNDKTITINASYGSVSFE